MSTEEEPKVLSSVTVRGGTLKRLQHASSSTSTMMTLAIFFPSCYEKKCAANQATPVLYWLSGLTCDDTNFCMKAGDRAFEAANAEGIAMVMPDTSPRGVDVANVDSYDLGQGAGFYVNATQEPYKPHYQMYSYVTEELPVFLSKWYKLGSVNGNSADSLQSVAGHSMGGHGALTIAFRDPSKWASVSAFSPICNPTNCPWGEKAFNAYLGSIDAGREHDASVILSARGRPFVEFDDILIEQGLADNFYTQGQLKPESLQEAATKSGQKNYFEHA